VLSAATVAGKVLDDALQAQSDQSKEGEQGSAGEGRTELIFIVENLDVERQRIGFPPDVTGYDGYGTKFSHGAGIAKQHAVEKAPLDIGESDAEENMPATRTQGDGCLFLVTALGFHQRNQLTGDEGKGNENRGDDDTRCGEDDLGIGQPFSQPFEKPTEVFALGGLCCQISQRFEKSRHLLLGEPSVGAEHHHPDQAGDDRRDGEWEIDQGKKEGPALEAEFRHQPCHRYAKDGIQWHADEGSEKRQLDRRKCGFLMQGGQEDFPSTAQGFCKNGE